MENLEPYTLAELLIDLKCNDTATIENKEFKEFLLFNNTYLSERLVFKNCNFIKDIHFENVDLKEGVWFENNCEISSLKITGCFTSRLRTNNLRISNSIINSLEMSNNYSFANHVYIIKTKMFNLCEISGFKSPKTNIKLSECDINCHLDFRQNKLDSFEISDSVITEGIIDIYDFNELQLLQLNNCNFKKEVILTNIKSRNIKIFKTKFENWVSIYNAHISDSIDIQECSFVKNFILKNHFDSKEEYSIENIYLNANKYEYQFDIQANSTKINELEIVYGDAHIGKLLIDNSNIGKVCFNGINSKLETNLEDCSIEYLSFLNFSNLNSIKINDIKPIKFEKSQISIWNSNLSKVQFYKIDFTQYKEIAIFNSNLTETTFANVSWFKKEQINAQSSDHKNYREVFRQLKYSLEKQGNKIDSLFFKSLEMEAYQNELRANSTSDRKDRWIMLFNSTNDFGLNWVKPVCWLIIGSFVFYILIIIGIDKRLDFAPNFSYNSLYLTYDVIKDNIKYYPRLLDPTNSLDRIFKEEKNYEIGFCVNAFSYLLKLYLAFFIVQTVKAFRKYAD